MAGEGREIENLLTANGGKRSWKLALLAAQPRVWAIVNWARLITCKIANLTREGQLLGNGMAGDDDFAGILSSRRLFE